MLPNEPLDLTPEQRLELTDEIIELLNDRKEGDPEWQRMLDIAFFAAAFDHDRDQPFFVGPDGHRYFGFKVPVTGTNISATCFQWVIDELITWGAGAAILSPEGDAAYVFSPGDVISLYLWQTTEVPWSGGWGEEPDMEAYSSGGNVLFGAPNAEMLSPMVARCVDFYLSLYFENKPVFAGRVPSVVTIRHESHTQPEDASDLVMNVFADDFPLPNGMTYETFLQWIGYLFPRHLRKRLLGMMSTSVDPESFRTLRQIYLDAGLEAIPKGT